ncbi:hypothetical protein GF362_02230 [Candidatus Dojkabacteria bacterium]|nr:hypothetical protein [Candidatus Dojkabacteria bacterium]
MDIKQYLLESEKTNSHLFNPDERAKNLLHGSIGISTEAGELLDHMKKHIYQDRDLDVVNIKEELGDIMWYMAIILRALNLDFEEILDLNIQKLRKRYGEEFDEQKALLRDLDEERKILEGKETK